MPIDLPEPGAVVHQLTTPGLGDHSYLVVVGEAAVVIDPQRDIDRFERAIADSAATLTAVFETHIHNDYVSGGPLLAARAGADYVLPSGSGSELSHRIAADRARFEVADGWTLVAIHAPGHTPHHMAYALVAPGGDAAVFTGGSMLVGAVGRCDLVSPDDTERLVRSQFRSVRLLADRIRDAAVVGPTHGAGSFCSATPVSASVSTIAAEKRSNPALVESDEDAFLETQLNGYRLYPAYYRHMGPANLAGVGPLPEGPLPEIGPDDLISYDGVVVDLRPAARFAAGHLPGSINVPAGDTAAIYTAWVLDWNTPLVLVGDPETVDDARRHLARIGYDAVDGAVRGGLEPWKGRLHRHRRARFSDLLAERPPVVLDVRDPEEAAADGALPGAVVIHVADLTAAADTLPPGEIWVHCASGYRAAMAIGLLEAAGRTAVHVDDDWDARYASVLAEPADPPRSVPGI